MKGALDRSGAAPASFPVSGLVSRRQAFIDAVWAGLAAPAMLFAPPPAYLVYDADEGVRRAWVDVAQRMSAAMSEHDG